MDTESVNQTLRNRSFEEICGREMDKKSKNLLDFDLTFGMWIWYGREHRLFLSESFTKMMGIPVGMIPNLELLVECVVDGDQERFLEFLEGMVAGEILPELTFRVVRGKRVRCVVERLRGRLFFCLVPDYNNRFQSI